MEQFAVPFTPEIKSGEGYVKVAAEQLNELIEKSKEKGWRFSHLEQISTYRDNGCIAGIFGNPVTPLFINLAILVKE